jgi:PPK2 family polyphosphate:nucleotide phosphotransferase
LFSATPSPYLVPFDSSFEIAQAPTEHPEKAPPKKKLKEDLDALTAELSDLQRRLYADDRHAVLLVFQAMDAAGKDGTIRAVMSGVNPAGCQVFSFKQPSAEELDHDFLWRTSRRLPERGRIGIFNRSYYEEVLVVRVHPEFLQYQKLPYPIDPNRIWEERFQSIRDHEQHLALNGTIVLKFWLNVSKEEQRQRFLARIEEPEKNWKFSDGDVKERALWDSYMHAYQEALRATSRPWAPWYAVPADNKSYMRACVSEIIVESLRSLELSYPRIGPDQRARLQVMRNRLEAEDSR